VLVISNGGYLSDSIINSHEVGVLCELGDDFSCAHPLSLACYPLMNNTHGSTPPYPNFDLPNHSTNLNKTLGIIGTPHEESISLILSTKTCQIKRNRRNPVKNSSNPRTPKTPKSSPLTHGFGRGITAQGTTKGSHKFSPTNPLTSWVIWRQPKV
jgi:hypothetical protein